MMTSGDALLAAINANPDEDTPRLIYADWLDEHDHPVRAEFIRLQCDLAQKENTLRRAMLDRHVDLFKRNQELLDEHRLELLGDFSALADETIEFDRGFVSRIELPVGKFLSHAKLISSVNPRPKVSVTSVGSRLSRFILSPHLDCVTKISVRSGETGSMAFWPDESQLFAAIRRLTGLEVLDLEGCEIGKMYWDQGFDFSLPKLVDLDLSHNEITDEGVKNLIGTGLLGQLKRLILRGNPIGDQGALDLAHFWPHESGIKELDLRLTNIGSRSHQALTSRFPGIIKLF